MEDAQSFPHSPSDDFSCHVKDGGSSATGGSSNGAKYRLMSPAKLPISRSTSITIPPGLSPTSFLESPVLLSNIKAEPSPTTGSFFKSQLMQGAGERAALLLDKHSSGGNAIDQGTSSSFEFNFHSGCPSAPGLSSMGVAIPAGLNRQQQIGPHSQVQDQLFSQSSSISSFVTCQLPSSKDLRVSATTTVHTSSVCDAVDELNHGDQSNTRIQVLSSDNKDSVSLVTGERTSDDGYNWRKYGQKLVKGCEFPRSYYKCTYPKCEVRKFFERSPSGHITEIVYKGSHDHPKPQPARRYNSGALMSIQEEKLDKDLSFTGQQDKLNANNLSSSVEPNISPVLSLQQANEDSLYGAGEFQAIDEDDPFIKRRKIEEDLDVTPVVKPIRDARVVVQTVSEVDVLDDGYRWRKYGQKVVRGNPNPRSYYKCTNAGCPVRKHVERASHDLKAVITTYEGKHNHDVPAAKNSSHEFAGTTPFSGTSIMKPEDKGSVSLDLGVGISQNQANEQLYNLNAQTAQSQIPPSDSSMMIIQPSQISRYGFVNGGLNLYGNRGNHVEGHNFQSQPVHASSQCPQNLGRILMGP